MIEEFQDESAKTLARSIPNFGVSMVSVDDSVSPCQLKVVRQFKGQSNNATWHDWFTSGTLSVGIFSTSPVEKSHCTVRKHSETWQCELGDRKGGNVKKKSMWLDVVKLIIWVWSQSDKTNSVKFDADGAHNRTNGTEKDWADMKPEIVFPTSPRSRMARLCETDRVRLERAETKPIWLAQKWWWKARSERKCSHQKTPRRRGADTTRQLVEDRVWSEKMKGWQKGLWSQQAMLREAKRVAICLSEKSTSWLCHLTLAACGMAALDPRIQREGRGSHTHRFPGPLGGGVVSCKAFDAAVDAFCSP